MVIVASTPSTITGGPPTSSSSEPSSLYCIAVLRARETACSPSNIMLLSNLVRLPLLFVSGVFLPIAQMPLWADWVAPISPLSYAGDLIRTGFGQAPYFPTWLSLLMRAAFTGVLFWGACRFQARWRAKGLQVLPGA